MKKVLLFFGLCLALTSNAQNFIGGANGTLLRSLDGGASWAPVPSGVTAEIHAVKTIGDTLYHAGQRGFIRKMAKTSNTSIQIDAQATSGNNLQLYNNIVGFTGVTPFKMYVLKRDNPGNSVGYKVSTDGGQTFSAPSGTQGPYYDIQTVSNSEAFYVKPNAVHEVTNNGTGIGSGNQGDIYTPQNRDLQASAKFGNRLYVAGRFGSLFLNSNLSGSSTFTKISLPNNPTVLLNDVRISPNGQNILVVGANGYAAISNDGGATWTSPTFNTPRTYALRVIQWLDNDTVLIGADKVDAGSQKLLVYRSTNKGLNFTELDATAFSTLSSIGAGSHGRTNNIFTFFDTKLGWMPMNGRGGNGEQLLYWTKDGGRTWQDLTWPTTNRNAQITALTHFSASELLACLDRRIYTSSDSGKTWTQRGSLLPANVNEFYNKGAGEVLAISQDDVMYSNDKGFTWTKTTDLSGLLGDEIFSFRDSVLVGSRGMAYKYVNNSQFSPIVPFGHVTGSFRGVAAYSSNLIYASGQRGCVMRTKNKGGLWEFVGDNSVNTVLNDIHFVTGAKGWAVGTRGQIWSTMDSGNTWTKQTIDTGITFYRIGFSAPDTGIIIGSAGRILRTVNGGTTWTSINSGTTQNLFGLDFGDARIITQPALPVSINSDTTTVIFGNTATLSFKVSDFIDITNFSTTLEFDPNLVRLTGANTTLPNATFTSLFDTTGQSTFGRVKLNFTAPTGFTTANNTSLIDMIFTPVANLDTAANIILASSTGTPAAQNGTGTNLTVTALGQGRIVITSILGLSAFENASLSIYPNPVNNILHFQTSGDELNTVSLLISDIAGKTVFQGSLNLLENNTLSTSTFRPGVYFLTLTHGTEQKTYKLIKE